MLSVIGRVVVTIFAFLVATGVTIFVLITLGTERLTHAVQGADDVTIGAAVELMGHAVALISTMTILPAVALVIVGEVARIRSIYYYVVGGGLGVGGNSGIDPGFQHWNRADAEHNCLASVCHRWVSRWLYLLADRRQKCLRFGLFTSATNRFKAKRVEDRRLSAYEAV